MTDFGEPVYYVKWTLPPGWVKLPTDARLDARSWAEATVRRRVAGVELLEESRMAAAADSLQVALEAAQEGPIGGPFLAAAFQPDPQGAVIAWADAVSWPWDQDGPLTLDQVAGMLASSEGTVGDRSSGRVTVQAGAAVWCRRMFEVVGPEGTVVLEGIAYAFLPEWLQGYVMLTSKWAALVDGDELADRVHELATRLVTKYDGP